MIVENRAQNLKCQNFVHFSPLREYLTSSDDSESSDIEVIYIDSD